VASIGIFGLGKIGAATNYLIEPRAAWSLFLAVVLGKTVRPSPRTGRVFGHRPVFFPVALVLVLHAVEFLCSSTLFMPAVSRLQRPRDSWLGHLVQRPAIGRYFVSRPPVLLARDNRNPTVTDRLNGQRIIAMLREVEGPAFCEHAIFPMLSGHTVYIQPFIMKQLAAEGKWDQMPVVEALQRGEFGLIVATEDVREEGFKFHYTPEMGAAIREAYRWRETLGNRPEGRATITHYVFESGPPGSP
jgi:hypothetical protein